MEIVNNTQIPMSSYQIENFVVRGQITTIRQVRQLFLELKICLLLRWNIKKTTTIMIVNKFLFKCFSINFLNINTIEKPKNRKL